MNKKEFVEVYLKQLLLNTDRVEITDVHYDFVQNEEYVTITYKYGFPQCVNVTGDSDLYLVSDVINAIKKVY